MAMTFIIAARAGLSSPSVRLYQAGADILLNAGGDTLTPGTNGTGQYTATIAETLSGWLYYEVLSGGLVYRNGFVESLDGGTVYAGEITSHEVPSNFRVASITTAGRIKIQGGVQKNVALADFEFLMVDATDFATPETGLTVTATRSIDGAAFASCANAVTEVANGIYKISLAAADLNGDVITLKFTASGSAARYITIRTSA